MRPTVKVTSHGDPSNQIATTSFVTRQLRGAHSCLYHIDECAFIPEPEIKSGKDFWKWDDLTEEHFKKVASAMGLSESFLKPTEDLSFFATQYNG